MSKIHESIDTANKYIETAIEKLDGIRGEGFAISHPEILGVLVQSAIVIRTGEILGNRIENVSNAISLERFER